jgi:radical SAM superfamily enzyme YgiQ (UPF0313 family)
LLYLATHLSRHGFDVSIIDGERVGRQQIRSSIASGLPDIVGITSTTFSFHDAAALAADVRRLAPQALIALGGPHASALAAESLKLAPQFDACVVGEGEESLLEIARGMPFCKIPGLVWHNGNGGIVSSPSRPLTSDLDRFDIDWELLSGFPRDYAPGWQDRSGDPSVSLVAGRGCGFECTFCASSQIHGSTRRTHSPAFVVNMIRGLFLRYGIREVYFHDDNFTQDRRWLREFCELMVSSKLPVRWSCASRAETLDDMTLARARAAGCFQIGIGVESAAQRMLDWLRKSTTIDVIASALDRIRSAGIGCKAYLIIGTSHERLTDLLKTWLFVLRHRVEHVQVSYFSSLPGSPAYDPRAHPATNWRRLNLLNPQRDAHLPRFVLRVIEMGLYASCYAVKLLPFRSERLPRAGGGASSD